MDKIEYRDHLYVLENKGVRQFLIIGPENALLIDMGFPDDQLYDRVKKLTSLPVQAVLTHSDFDHCGGAAAFGECWVHPADAARLPEGVTAHEIHEGDLFSAGEYCFEAIETPGHTYGSVAFLDRKHRLLISGDPIQAEGPIFMFGEHRNLGLYLESLKKIADMADAFDEILPSHHRLPVHKEDILHCIEDATALRDGKLSGKPHPEMPCEIYQGKWTEFFY